jgi:drug/metabolite transporter (DMT)-like permease
MTWPVFLITSILLTSLNGLFHRSLLKDDKSDPIAQTIVFLGIGGIIALAIALFRGTLQLTFPLSLSLNFAILALITLGYVLKYRGYQLLNASEVVIFASTSKLWNVVGASIFLHETVTLTKLLGTLVILLGVAVTMYVDKKFKFNKGILVVLIGAVIFGLTDINGFYILQTFDASSFQVYAYLLPVIILLLIRPNSVKKLSYYFTKDRGMKVILLSAFDTLGMLALFFAYQAGGKASIIGPLSATKLIVTVLLAMVILKERDHITNKIIGAVITVLGVILLL